MNISVKACITYTPPQLATCAIRVTEPQEKSPGSQLHQRKNSITVALQHIWNFTQMFDMLQQAESYY